VFKNRECLLNLININLLFKFVRKLVFIFSSYMQFYCVIVASLTINPKLFECKKCGRMYMTKSSLKSHVEVICGKPPKFKYNLCNQRTFKQKGNYKLHLLCVHNIKV